MIFITAQTRCVGKGLTSGFPVPSLWQADTEAKQAGKILLVTRQFHEDIKQKKAQWTRIGNMTLSSCNEKY